ncbi:MAG: type II restriction endonuclease [Caldilineaceae bacterium]|nr:type II restriction endonuclease [Caldilineaceae bacterium]
MDKDNPGLHVPGPDAELLSHLFERCDRVLVKKLSNNDRDWARFPNKHQAGVYIPSEQRDSGFFPDLKAMQRRDPTAAEIRERFFATIWPQFGAEKCSRLVHYTSKGQETHLTRLPKEAFAELLPASFLVMGRKQRDDTYSYECLSIDSASEEADLLHATLDLKPDFLIEEYDPVRLKDQERERVLAFTDEVISAWLAGEIKGFADSMAMPKTIELARMARACFLKSHGLERLNPFELAVPGDVLCEISRSIELDIFWEFQRRQRSVELIRVLLGDYPKEIGSSDVIRALIDQYQSVYALMRSATQQSRTRAGYSYEYQIEAMLAGGGIPFEKQVSLSSGRRSDFVLPSQVGLERPADPKQPGLILSVKTTLRDRWKQVLSEQGEHELYLATVDENIPATDIEEMASSNIHLVVPENLKTAKTSEYKGHDNVLSFKEFCDEVVAPRMPVWES